MNRTFTTRINELTEAESRAVLDLLFDHCEQIEDLVTPQRRSRSDERAA